MKKVRRFTHLQFLDPDWKPGPGQKFSTDCPKAEMEVTKVTTSRVYYRYVSHPGSAVAYMERGLFERLYPGVID